MFTKILCATDGSPHAERALHIAAGLAADAGAAIDVVHVIEDFPAGRAGGWTIRVDESELQERIAAQVAAAATKSVTHLPHAAAGKTARRIAELAQELGVDLIVVGTRGHSSLAGAVLGSVTQRLLHDAPCPVLAVPPAHEAVAATRDASRVAMAE